MLAYNYAGITSSFVTIRDMNYLTNATWNPLHKKIKKLQYGQHNLYKEEVVDWNSFRRCSL